MVCSFRSRYAIEDPDHRHCRLLSARRERPRGRRAAEVAKNFRRPMGLAM